MRFTDRDDAGRQLAEVLLDAALTPPILVLALPRGGVPVGAAVASELHAELDVFVSRKVGAPHHPEYGIGAVAEGGARVVDRDAVRQLGLDDAAFERLVEREAEEVQRRVNRYRSGRPLAELADRDVVLVDDGLATGVTAEAALRSIRDRHPRRLVLAVPVCPAQTAHRMQGLADDVVTVTAADDLRSVGEWYDDFRQTTDDEVLTCLAAAHGSV